MRTHLVSASVALLVMSLGCVTPEQKQDLEFRLKKAQTDADTCQQSLADERAKSVALRSGLETAERRAASAEAMVANLNERLATAQKNYEDYKAQIEARASAPMSRPSVPVSPLPRPVDEALQAFAAKYEKRVWYERGRGAVSFANDQLFDAGGDTLRADAHAALHELGAIISQSLPEAFEAVVVGHTDDSSITKEETRAKHPTNWHLSVHRAIAVRDVLEQAGVPPARLAVMGYGPYRPASDDRTRNRRVEVFLVRKGEVQSLEPIRVPRR